MAYLTQLVDTSTLARNKLNVLVAPCGSGKTKFAINHITSGKYPLGRILYVIDVNNNKDHFLTSYPDLFIPYSPSWRRNLGEDWVHFSPEENKVTIINYAQLGGILTHYPNFYTSLDLVILDEPHHFFKYNAQYIHSPLSTSQLVYTAIKHMATNPALEAIAITATPSKVYKYLPAQYISMVPYDAAKLTRYLTSAPAYHTTPNAALRHILRTNPSPHILVYTPYIRSMEKLQALFTSHGLNAVCLWSRNNTDHPYSPTQEAVYNHLLRHKILPPEIDVVILNAAFETGMDINDGRFTVFWGQSSDVDSLVQARGRIRGDITSSVVVSKQVYWERIQGGLDWGKEEWRSKTEQNLSNSNCGRNSGERETRLEGGEKATNKDIVPSKYLDVFLTTQDKNNLCLTLNIKDDSRRMLKWTGVKQYLTNNGYEITSTRKTIDKKRVKGDIISKR